MYWMWIYRITVIGMISIFSYLSWKTIRKIIKTLKEMYKLKKEMYKLKMINNLLEEKKRNTYL